MIKQLFNFFQITQEDDEFSSADEYLELDDELGEFLEEKNASHK
ncbi:MAG: hypothetical protein ABF649_21600 [Bacillus sp. (in: firmicutes)]